MNEKLEKLNQEIEKTEKKLRRAQHEEKILEHQIKTLTRKEGTPDKDVDTEGTDAPALHQSRHAGKLPSPPGSHHG